jgi:hypothetical protein
VAFFVVGLPGLLLSAWVATLREPVRGAMDGLPPSPRHPRPFAQFLRELRGMLPPLSIVHLYLERAGGAAIALNLAFGALVALAAFGVASLLGTPIQWVALGIGLYAAFSWAQALRLRDRPPSRSSSARRPCATPASASRSSPSPATARLLGGPVPDPRARHERSPGGSRRGRPLGGRGLARGHARRGARRSPAAALDHRQAPRRSPDRARAAAARALGVHDLERDDGPRTDLSLDAHDVALARPGSVDRARSRAAAHARHGVGGLPAGHHLRRSRDGAVHDRAAERRARRPPRRQSCGASSANVVAALFLLLATRHLQCDQALVIERAREAGEAGLAARDEA